MILNALTLRRQLELVQYKTKKFEKTIRISTT